MARCVSTIFQLIQLNPWIESPHWLQSLIDAARKRPRRKFYALNNFSSTRYLHHSERVIRPNGVNFVGYRIASRIGITRSEAS